MNSDVLLKQNITQVKLFVCYLIRLKSNVSLNYHKKGVLEKIKTLD